MLGLNDIKKMRTEEIFDLLKKYIDDSYYQYESLLNSKPEYYQMVLNEINMSKYEFNDEIPYTDYIEDKIQYSIFKLIVNRFISKEKGAKLGLANENSIYLINIYLREVYSKPILSKETRDDLVFKLSSGDKEARRKLIESNLRIVVNTAIIYLGHGMDFLDMIQEGNIALQNAIDNFDLKKSNNFWNYIYISVKGSIISKIKHNDCNTKYLQKYESNKVEESTYTMEDMACYNELSDEMIDFIDKCRLSNMEYNVIKHIFGIDSDRALSMQEIKDIYGISYKCVSYYYRSALKKLKYRAERLQNDKENLLKEDYIILHNKELCRIGINIPYCTVSKLNKIFYSLSMFELQIIRYWSSGIADELVLEYTHPQIQLIIKNEIIPKLQLSFDDLYLVNKSLKKHN